MMDKGHRAFCCVFLILLAVSLSATSCKIPEEKKEKEKDVELKEPADTMPEPTGEKVPYTSKIKYDIWAEKDEESPSVIHVTAKPVIEEDLLADHPGGRLEIEVYPRRGIKLIKGRHRYRTFLRSIEDAKIELDIRKDTFGVSKIDFEGEILASDGSPLIKGTSSFKVLAHPDEKVILDQKKIEEYLKKEKKSP
ncbi:MAG: hypothetical protein R6V10_04395 [bacterium]